MKADRIMDALGKVKEDYIMESAPCKKKNRTPHFRWIAAAIALVMILAFFQTAPGVAALEFVKESISKLIEVIFPPKDIIVMPEGDFEVVHHEAQGRDPDEESPGFVMYVDTESYVMTEENGAYFVRQIPIEYDREEIRRQQAALLEGLSPEEQEEAIDARIQELEDFYASLPANEIEIREVADKEFSAYAEEVRNQIPDGFEITTDLIWIDKPLAYTFSVTGGNTWDSPCEVHYFVDNGKQGSFHIVARYTLEAAEGHGTRFTSMIQTFEVVTNEETSQYNGEDLLGVMHKEVDNALARNEALLLSADQESTNQADLNTIAQQRYTLWLETMDKLWVALEQKLDANSMQDLLFSQLNWSIWKAEELDKAVADVGNGSLSTTVFYGNGADMLEQRVDYLLNVLDGKVSLQSRNPSGDLSPEMVISKFLKAYYSGDRDAVKQYLSASYNLDVDVYTDYEPADPEISTIKGLDNLVHDMADWGTIRPSIQFRITPDSDYYVYLSMTLTWEDDQWKVSEYGLEG